MISENPIYAKFALKIITPFVALKIITPFGNNCYIAEIEAVQKNAQKSGIGATVYLEKY